MMRLGRAVTSRRAFLAVLVGGALAVPRGGDAQQAATARLIGFLRPGPPPKTFVEALQQGLREHGYVAGENVVIDYRVTAVGSEQLSRLAEELVRLNVDVILASGGPAAVAARNATRTLPIVFAGVYDPVETGLVPSLVRPGGNVTGLSVSSADLAGKRLELLRELVPKLTRVAMLWDAGNRANAVQLKGAEQAARALGIELQPLAVRRPDDFDAAFKAARGAQGLLQAEGPLFTTHRAQLTELAVTNRLPAIYGFRDFVDAGGVMSYGADPADWYKRAAAYVDKIFKGARPGDLPVEQPTTFDLVINMKTAKALGLRIPPALLLRADHVID